MRLFPTLLALLVASFMAATFAEAIAGPVENSDSSHGRSVYSAADLLQRLNQDADQGSPLAQYVLGVMYQLGEAVPQDNTEAVKWLRRAADQGLAVAQFALGEMYALGRGVPEDPVSAHMWFDLSETHAIHIAGAQAEKLARDAQEIRDALERKMSPAQIAKAHELAKEWKPKPER